MKRIAILLAVLLTACGGEEHSDLKQELNNLTKDVRGEDRPAPRGEAL